MEQVILQTLVKYNEIFDALQKVFHLHNYNCSEQRQKLLQYVKDAKATECIYITYNPASDILPLQDEFARQERKIKEIASDERILLEKHFIQQIEAMKLELTTSYNEKLEQQLSELVGFKNHVHETYQTKLDQRLQRNLLEERLAKLNEQIEFIQQKYALKGTTEQNIVEVKNSISNISQSIHFLRQDSVTMNKQLKVLQHIQQGNHEALSGQIAVIKDELLRFDVHQQELEKLHQREAELKEDFELMYQKFKSIAQLFQELDANTSKNVKFEIHTALKGLEEQISFQDQIQVYKEQIEKYQTQFAQFKQSVDNQISVFEVEQEYNNKQFKNISKLLEQFKAIQSSSNQTDILPKILQLQERVQNSQKRSEEIFQHLKRTFDVVQEFCETLQIPTDHQEKDLTSLILLLDRRMIDLHKILSEQVSIRKSSNRAGMKLQTPRMSTSFDSPFRIHSKQKSQYNQISQTISFDQKQSIDSKRDKIQ